MTADNALLYSIVAAALPALLYVGLIYWVDRYEKEPLWLLSATFLWGAVPSVLLALVFSGLLSLPFYAAAEESTADALSAVAVAPLVEETVKALVLIAIFVRRRQEIDSLLDGVIYGAMVGMGFAVVENVFYFLAAFEEGGAATWNAVVFSRAVVFGLNHAFYTSLTGLGIAAARLSPKPAVRVVAPVLGWAAAVFTHAVHNFTATMGSALFCVSGLLFDWGGILVTVVIIVWALAQERRWMRDYLVDEVERGGMPVALYDLTRSAAARGRFRLRLLFGRGPAAHRQAGRLLQRYSELAYQKRHHRIFDDERSALAIARLRKEIARLQPATVAAWIPAGDRQQASADD